MAGLTAGFDEAVDAGKQIGGALVHGLADAAGAALSTGAQLGEAVMQGVMSPLGQSGAEISKLAGSAMSAVGGIAQAVFGGVSAVVESGLKLGGAVASSLMGALSSVGGAVMNGISQLGGTLMNGLGSLFSAAGPIAGQILSGIGSAVTSIGSALMGAVTGLLSSLASAVVGAVTGLLQAVGQIAGQLGQVALQGFQALVGIVQDVFGSAMQQAKQISSLSNQTGMSMESASKMTTDFGALGVDAGSLGKTFSGSGMSEEMMRRKGDMYGVNDESGHLSAEKFAGKYQEMKSSGPAGFMQAEAMRNNMGLTSPDMLRVANTDVGKIKQEQNYAKGMQSSLGVSPDVIKKFSEDFPALINRISEFVNMVKMRFASELLPVISGALTQVTQFISKNADGIAGGLKRGASWIVNDLPQMVLSGFSTMLGFGIGFLKGVSAIATTIADMLDSFANGDGIIYSIALGVATFIDYLSVGFRGLMQLLAPIGAILIDIVISAVDNFILLGQAIGTVLSVILDFAASIPGVSSLIPQEALDIAHGMRDMEQIDVINPMDAFDAASNIGTSDAVGKLGDFQDGARAAGKWTREKVAAPADTASKYLGEKQKSVDGVKDNLPKFTAALEKTAENTTAIADHTRKTAEAVHRQKVGDLSARMGAMMIQSWHRSQSRS